MSNPSPSDTVIVGSPIEELIRARRERAVARCDLDWETERQTLCWSFEASGEGKLPNRNEARDAMLGGVVLFTCACALSFFFGWFALLLTSPLLFLSVALAVSGVREYFGWKRYERGNIRYQLRREAIAAGESWKADALGLTLEGHADRSCHDLSDLTEEELAARIALERYHAELARMDLEWESEKQKYYIIGRRGDTRSLPDLDRTNGLWSAGGGLLFGASVALLGSKGLELLICELISAAFVVYGLYSYFVPSAYAKAVAEYEKRRAALNPHQFRD